MVKIRLWWSVKCQTGQKSQRWSKNIYSLWRRASTRVLRLAGMLGWFGRKKVAREGLKKWKKFECDLKINSFN